MNLAAGELVRLIKAAPPVRHLPHYSSYLPGSQAGDILTFHSWQPDGRAVLETKYGEQLILSVDYFVPLLPKGPADASH